MSGSYDRLGGRPLPGARRAISTRTTTTDRGPVRDDAARARRFLRARGRAAGRSAAADPLLRARRPAPARARRSPAPIVPPGSVTGHSLTLVISIMCFLASLTAATVYMINQSADAWLHDIASEVTVQVEPREGADAEALAQEVAVFLGRQRGVRTAARSACRTPPACSSLGSASPTP